MVLGRERTIGTDFVRILIGLSSIFTLIYGFKLKKKVRFKAGTELSGKVN